MQQLNTRQWKQRDISRIKQALPEGIAFGSLSTPTSTTFQLELETPVDAAEVSELAAQAEDALGDLGIPVEQINVGSGYSGAMNPGVLLTVKMDA